MRRVLLCLSLCVGAGCSGAYPDPPAEEVKPFASVDTAALKLSLTELEKSGRAGSGIGLIRSGVEATGKADLMADMEELAKADAAGQKAKVKSLATKMLKSL